MKKLIAVCICALWMGVIFYNSSNSGTISQERSRSLVTMVKAKYESFQVFNNSEILNSINKNSNWSKRDDKFNKILRKNAHVFEYLVLSIVVTTLLFSLNLKGKSAIIYIMFICLFYAVTDEFHQQFIPGRSALVSDVLIDFGGSIIGILIFYLFYYTAYKKLKAKT